MCHEAPHHYSMMSLQLESVRRSTLGRVVRCDRLLEHSSSRLKHKLTPRCLVPSPTPAPSPTSRERHPLSTPQQSIDCCLSCVQSNQWSDFVQGPLLRARTCSPTAWAVTSSGPPHSPGSPAPHLAPAATPPLPAPASPAASSGTLPGCPYHHRCPGPTGLRQPPAG